MEETGVEILKQIAGNSPIILLMGTIIYYLTKRLSEKEKEIKDLQTEMRNSEKESLGVLTDLNVGLEKISEAIENSTEKVIDKIQQLREYINDKIGKK